MPRFKSRRSYLLALACTSLFSTVSVVQSAQAQTPPTLQPGVISFADSGEYPPMEFMANGKLVGYDIDMGNELARRMGLKPDWVIVQYTGIVGTLKSKRTDLIISSFTITPQRQEQVSFSDPYLDADIAAAVRKPDAGLTAAQVGPNDIIGVQLGTSGAAWARAHFPSGANIKVYDDLNLALKDLAAGRVKLVVNNVPALKYQSKQLKDLVVTSGWEKFSVGIGARKDDPVMVAALNKTLAAMKADGFMKQLDTKWFGAQ